MSWLWKLKEKVAIALGKFSFQPLEYVIWIKDLGSNLMFVNLSQFVCIIVQLTQI